MIRRILLLLFLASHYTPISRASFKYRDAQQQLCVLNTDPVELLDTVALHINEYQMELSFDERDAIIEQLQQLKKRLCWRPGAGLLALPLLATVATGFYMLSTYIQLRNIQDAPKWAKMILLSEQETFYDFINSFLHFIVIAIATFMVGAEYCGRIDGLFAKERALECKIDEIITLLQW